MSKSYRDARRRREVDRRTARRWKLACVRALLRRIFTPGPAELVPGDFRRSFYGKAGW